MAQIDKICQEASDLTQTEEVESFFDETRNSEIKAVIKETLPEESKSE